MLSQATPGSPRMISTWILRNRFCRCSPLSNDDIISGLRMVMDFRGQV